MRERDYYPAGAYDDPSAPFNQVDIPEKEFQVCVTQALSKSVPVWTSNYIPGACGVDYEPDGEGGCCSSSWQDPDDTSDTNWEAEYASNGYHTPLQLIEMLKEYLQKDLKKWEEKEKQSPKSGAIFQVRKMERLIKECEDWCDDETEILEDK